MTILKQPLALLTGSGRDRGVLERLDIGWHCQQQQSTNKQKL